MESNIDRFRKLFDQGKYGSCVGAIQTEKREILVQSLSVLCTERFSGLIDGQATKEINDATLSSIDSFSKKLGHSSDGYLLLQPNREMVADQNPERTQEHEKLPNYFAVVSLQSTATDPSEIYSSLVLTFFVNDIDMAELPSRISEIVCTIDYEKNAKDWSP